jgi:hypothetical protein
MIEEAQSRLRESIIVACLEDLDWERLRAHLEGVELDDESAGKLVALVMRTRSFVFRYPGKLKKRTAILDGVAETIRASLGDEAAATARARFDLFALIDEGYAALRGLIEGLAFSTWPKPVFHTAYLTHVAQRWCELQEQIETASASSHRAGGVILTSPEGVRYGADAAISQLVNLMSMNAMLSAYGGKWFDADGIIRAPDFVATTEKQVTEVRAADITAVLWQQWQLVEERCRFLDGGLGKHPAPADGFPEDAQIIAHHSESFGWDLLDFAANERLGDRLGQTFQEMALKTNLLKMGQGIEPGTAMPPAGWVSPAEAHSTVMLCEYLGLDVATHPAELGGLRLAEWVRGFAVLQQLATARLKSQKDPVDRTFPRVELAELEAVLARNGLTGGKARAFIDHASFARSSRDLYDAPILRGDGGWCRIAGPGLVGALLLRLVLSTLANKELVIDGKGEAFEEQFRKQFTDRGLPVYHFTASRPGGPYEYDAIMPWGKYLFVFECKNRSLSSSNPVASYNLLRSTTGHVRQVQRLVTALREDPSILTQFLKEDCTNLTIVPVVMNSMPFSVKGTVDGIFFADAGSTSRFFQERHMHISRAHQIGEIRVMYRVPTHSQWEGETPSADDFMRHLEDPLPLQIMVAHLSFEPIVFQLGPVLYAATQVPRRGEITIESMAGLAGLTEAQVQAELDRITSEAIAPVSAAVESQS